ncbi:hypothetical protein TNCV_2687191 [Trichonephila clavipes]|nr:hypothetical protein TNCV_2687191 [Trichonephila clavipes]
MGNVTDWQKVVFSDESRFVLGTDDNRVRMWRRPGTEKAYFLTKKGVLVMPKVSRSTSFYSIKNLVKRSIKGHAGEDLYNRVSHKSWWNAILKLDNGSRRRAVAEFRLATGHD